MRKPEELKQLLAQIKDNDCKVPEGTDVDGIISDMLRYIGHTDGELRDKLIYSTFCGWIDNGTLSVNQMKHILTTCLGEQCLFYCIGENNTDSVFTRSFSSLAIALAFAMHDEKPFLTIDELQNIKKTVLRYVCQEKDYRGYVDGKGWAHAIAHVADALANIAGCEIDGSSCLNSECLLEILQAVKALVCNKDYVYTAEEDERLVVVINSVCSNETLTHDDIISWIDSFNLADKKWWKGTVPDDFNLHVNRKHFMRSLYVNFLSCDDNEFDNIRVKDICEHLRSFLVD